MNEIVNKFLLVGDEFTPESIQNNLVLLKVLVVHSPQTKKELKSLCRLEIQALFTETSFIRFAFNMIWFMANQKI